MVFVSSARPQKPAINGLPPTPKVLVSESSALSLTVFSAGLVLGSVTKLNLLLLVYIL